MYSGKRRARGARAALAARARLRRRVYVGDQPLVARRVLARHHHRLAHAGRLAQARLDLARARCGSRGSSPGSRCGPGTRCCRPAASAPGRRSGTAARRARSRTGSAHEALGGQLRPVQVAARHAGAADVQLARHARPAPAAAGRRARRSACWQSGGRSKQAASEALPSGRSPDRALRRPVGVNQASPCAPAFDQGRSASLSGGDQGVQRRQGRARRHRHQDRPAVKSRHAGDALQLHQTDQCAAAQLQG